MPRYAIIESVTGYVWGVVDASSARDACYTVDRVNGAGPSWGAEGTFLRVSARELHTNRSLYDVRLVPPGFDVWDGTSHESVAAVKAMPRAECYVWNSWGEAGEGF